MELSLFKKFQSLSFQEKRLIFLSKKGPEHAAVNSESPAARQEILKLGAKILQDALTEKMKVKNMPVPIQEKAQNLALKIQELEDKLNSRSFTAANLDMIEMDMKKIDEEIKTFSDSYDVIETSKASQTDHSEDVSESLALSPEDLSNKKILDDLRERLEKIKIRTDEEGMAEIEELESQLEEIPSLTDEAIRVIEGHIIKLEQDLADKDKDKDREKLGKKVEERKLIQQIAETIEESPEDIKNALRHYDSGRHENEHSQESEKAKEILDKIQKAKQKGKLKETAFDYMGGTDGQEHQAVKSESYHERKAAALQTLIAFKGMRKLEINLDLNEERMKLIEGYIEAVKNKTGHEYIEEHKDSFRPGGQILDAALAVQRAQNMMQRIEGENTVLHPEFQFLKLELNQAVDGQHRKSGLLLTEISKEKPVEQTDEELPDVPEVKLKNPEEAKTPEKTSLSPGELSIDKTLLQVPESPAAEEATPAEPQAPAEPPTNKILPDTTAPEAPAAPSAPPSEPTEQIDKIESERAKAKSAGIPFESRAEAAVSGRLVNEGADYIPKEGYLSADPQSNVNYSTRPNFDYWEDKPEEAVKAALADELNYIQNKYGTEKIIYDETETHNYPVLLDSLYKLRLAMESLDSSELQKLKKVPIMLIEDDKKHEYLGLVKENDQQLIKIDYTDSQPSIEAQLGGIGQLAEESAESTKQTPYKLHINALELPEADKTKLLEMISPENYNLAVQAATEVGNTQALPTLEQVEAELMKLTPERLKEICEMMEKPTLLMVPNGRFEYKAANMTKKRQPHVIQNVAVYKGDNNPYDVVVVMDKGTVSIVDGVTNPKQLDGVTDQIGPRRKYLTEQYTAKNLKHISAHEYATLIQKSSIEGEVIDTQTITILEPSTLTESPLVAGAYFKSSNKRVHFDCSGAERHIDNLRGRASMQVMEF